MKAFLSLPLGLALAAIGGSPVIHAATYSWLGATDGNWNTPANWDAGTPVSAADTAVVFDNATQLATANNIPGGLTLNALTFGPGSGARTVSGNTLTFDGATPTLTMANTLGDDATNPTTLNTNMVLNQTLTVHGGVDFTHQLLTGGGTSISGAGGIVWASGIGRLNGSANFAGSVVVQGGAMGMASLPAASTLAVGSGGSFQLQSQSLDVPISLSGGGFAGTHGALHASSGTSTIFGDVTLAADASLGAFAGATMDVRSEISGDASLSISSESTGVVMFRGGSANTFTGGLALDGGKLQINDENKLGASGNTVTLNGAVLQAAPSTFSLSLSAAHSFVAGAGGLGLLHGHDTITVAAPISGGAVRIDGSVSTTNGKVIFSGAKSFTGGLALGTFGVLEVAGELSLGAAGGAVSLDGGTIQTTAGFTLSAGRAVTVTSNGGVLANFDPASPLVVAADVSGGGRLQIGTPFATGEVVLGGTNTQLGGTLLRGATLQLADDTKLGAAGSVFEATTGTARATASFAFDRPTRFGRDDLTGEGATLDTAGFDVTLAGTTEVEQLTKDGAGSLIWNAANTASSGFVEVRAGTLRTGAADVLGGIEVSAFGGSVVDFDGFDQTLAGIRGAGDFHLGDATVTVTDFSSAEVSGAISGSGGLVIDGGRAVLTGANTFEGGVNVLGGGELTIGSTAALGAPGNPIHIENGTLSAGGGGDPVVISATLPLTFGAGPVTLAAEDQSLVVERQLTTPVAFGGDRVILANTGNTFVGDIQIGHYQGNGADGLGIVANGSLGDSANVLTLGERFNDGESDRFETGRLTAHADFVIPASRTIRLDGGDDFGSPAGGGEIDTNGFTVTIDTAIGELSPDSPLVKSGSGTLLLDGANTYTGRTDIFEGTLGGTGSLGRVLVHDGATLAPGHSAGLLTIDGDATVLSGATLEIEIGGIAAVTGHDRLVVTGDYFNEGIFSLAFIDGFAPAAGQEFAVLHVDGAFDNAAATFAVTGLQPGWMFDTGFDPVTREFSILSLNDGMAAVPEPSTMGLAFAAFLIVLAIGRRRKNSSAVEAKLS